jgi:cobalt-precorrin-5B (C1)-methyltransferase
VTDAGRERSTGLRYGWTTGACATAATTAAYTALLTGEFPDPVQIDLPHDKHPAFALAREALSPGVEATVGIVKDAGDDPDVTHGALVSARVTHGEPGSGVVFRAGEGVGTVTKPGLPLAVGEPAINPMPRQFISEHVAAVAAAHGGTGDVVVEVSVENGEELARKTWNPRLGILGGLSSSPTPAPRGSTRSAAASTSRGPSGTSTSRGAPARPASGSSPSSTGCPRTPCSTWATSPARCSSTSAATPCRG